MNDLKVFVLNEGGFAPLDKDNFISYQELEIDALVPEFIRKRLEFFGYKNYQFIHKLDEISQCDSKFAAVINIENPFIDPDLLDKIFLCLKK